MRQQKLLWAQPVPWGWIQNNMGKIRTRVLGMEDVEKEQKQEQKKRAQEKKVVKSAKAQEPEASQAPKEEKKTTSKPKKVVDVKAHANVRGKKYRSAQKQVDNKKTYSLGEAITLLKKIKYAAFDESVELHINTKEADIKGELSLPHAAGKTVRVAIVDDKVLDQIGDGKIEFDVLIAHPSFMPKLAKYARTLGPKGLMPNPKAGTISTNPEEVAKKYAGGLIRWKTEIKSPLIHLVVGKISQKDDEIVENTQAFIASVNKNNVKSAYIKTTMSPALQISLDF